MTQGACFRNVCPFPAPQHRFPSSLRCSVPQACPRGRQLSVARSYQRSNGGEFKDLWSSIYHKVPRKNNIFLRPGGSPTLIGYDISKHGGRQRICMSSLLVSPTGDGDKNQPADFAKKLDQVWGIRKQPHPVPCETCGAEGGVECPWCKGTGFFILGDNMLCEVPSRNTSCHICQGAGTTTCEDCKGTGYRAKWMGLPVKKPQYDGPIDPL